MLIEFNVENYLCFKDRVTLSMVASSNTENEENTFKSPGFPGRLLKSCVIYGANASGKSNLLKAMGFMGKYVLYSSKESQATEEIPVTPFRLSEGAYNKPSAFEMSFILGETRYRYGFELDREKVHSEWLYYVPTSKETKLFIREGNHIEYNKTRFREGKGLGEKTRENALFLSVCAQFNGEISQKIIKWFSRFNVISSLSPEQLAPITLRLMKNEKYENEIAELMKIADLGIENIHTEHKEIDVEIFPFLKPIIKDFAKKAGDIVSEDEIKVTNEIIETYTHHKRYNKDNESLSIETFNLDDESEGTKKLFYLSGPILDTMHKGQIVAVDELDTSLHPIIVQEIIRLFNSYENKKNAQLIFNTHNTTLLSKKLFRRDQVWFVEKDMYGSSDLYSLAEYRVRKDASFEKDYIHGKYGAIPFVGDFRRLTGDMD
ncbi:MAG: ATP-binding protein [Candidatus Eremiobacteraeota bacterium]|nr:ATP-binding protein [Candidatus Eremiobacteraeota bacterium]